MTINEFIARVEDCPMPRYYKHQVIQWLSELDLPEKLVIQEKYKAMQPVADHIPTQVVLSEMWQQVSKHYEIDTPIEKRNRCREFVTAKIHFARLVKMQYPYVPIRMVAKFMGKDRSSVYHYWYYSGYACDLPPIPKTKKIKHDTNKNAESANFSAS